MSPPRGCSAAERRSESTATSTATTGSSWDVSSRASWATSASTPWDTAVPGRRPWPAPGRPWSASWRGAARDQGRGRGRLPPSLARLGSGSPPRPQQLDDGPQPAGPTSRCPRTGIPQRPPQCRCRRGGRARSRADPRRPGSRSPSAGPRKSAVPGRQEASHPTIASHAPTRHRRPPRANQTSRRRAPSARDGRRPTRGCRSRDRTRPRVPTPSRPPHRRMESRGSTSAHTGGRRGTACTREVASWHSCRDSTPNPFPESSYARDPDSLGREAGNRISESRTRAYGRSPGRTRPRPDHGTGPGQRSSLPGTVRIERSGRVERHDHSERNMHTVRRHGRRRVLVLQVGPRPRRSVLALRREWPGA